MQFEEHLQIARDFIRKRTILYVPTCIPITSSRQTSR